RSKVKVMLTVSLDCHGVLHTEFLLEHQTVNKEYFLSVTRRLREQFRRKRQEMWFFFLILPHVIAHSHKSIIVNICPKIQQVPWSNHSIH
ncbi:hypothetical protein F3H11_36920, partial [Pseudomonas aeruginosa]